MGRFSFTVRRTIVAIVATFAASLVVSASGAQAIVVNDNGVTAGVALVGPARGAALPAGVTALTSASTCTDPWLAADLGGPNVPSNGLCYRGGAVMHKNETFALTWDQHRAYWSQTRGYVEQFLRDVANSSGSLGSPYAVTTQYNDAGGRAQNASLFGGGCIDYGVTGGSACNFGSPTGVGHDFPAGACTSGGDSFIAMGLIDMNTLCLTDSQLQGEIATMVAQTGMIGRTVPGYTPIVNLLLPPGVNTCLDTSGSMCSMNSFLIPPPATVLGSTQPNGSTVGLGAGTYLVEVTYVTSSGESVPSSAQAVVLSGAASNITVDSPPAAPGVTGWNVYISTDNGTTFARQNGSPLAIGATFGPVTSLTGGVEPPTKSAFCSYHSHVNVGGTEVAYVVQPWTAGTACDEPDVPSIPDNPPASVLSVAIGQRLVSPISQSHIAAIVNPALTGWVSNNGLEIDDNALYGVACQPFGNGLDKVTLGGTPYWLQREFNNAATMEFDPFTYFGCAPQVDLAPNFVAPSAVNQGDEVQFDGSSTASTLIVPNAGYVWNFGDGTALATGPSVVHTFAKAGTYTVSLYVTDRGVNKATFSQTVTVLTSNGQPAPPPATGGGGATSGGSAPFQVHLQLLPESLRSMITHGLRLRVSANRAANGLVTVAISRQAARRLHIQVGRSATVVIGRGTVWQVKNGTVVLNLHLAPKMASKLHKLRHLTVTVRLSLVPAVGHRLAIVVAGRY